MTTLLKKHKSPRCFIKIWQLENGIMCYHFSADYCEFEEHFPQGTELKAVASRALVKVNDWIQQEQVRNHIEAEMSRKYNEFTSLPALIWIKEKLEETCKN